MGRVLILSLLVLIFTDFYAQESGKIETQIQKGHIQPVSTLDWHPSGEFFASGGADHAIILWNAQTGKQIRQFNYHTGKVLNLQFSNDGSQLLSSGGDNNIFVVDVLTGKLLENYAYEEVNAYPMSVSFSVPENFILVGDNRNNLLYINRKTGKQTLHKKGFSAGVNPLTISPDERMKLIVENYKTAFLINDLTKDSTTLNFDKPYNYSFSPDGKQLALGSEKLILSIYDVESGKEIKTLTAEKQCDGCKMKFDYSNDGKYLATYDSYNGLIIYKTSNFKPIGKTLEFETTFSSVSFSPAGNYVLLNEGDEFKIISVKDNREVLSLSNKHFESVDPVISPDDKFILTGEDFFTIQSYSLPSGKKHFNYKGFHNEQSGKLAQVDYTSWFNTNIINHIKLKPAVAISAEGLIAQGKKDSLVTLFDLNTGRFKAPLVGHSAQVISLAFHPAKNELATGDASGQLIIWDLDKNQVKKSFRAHVSFVMDLAYNSTGDELLSSSWDATIKHWKLNGAENENPESIGYIDLKNNSAFKVKFSPNDLYLLAGDVTENVTFYEADTKKHAFDLIGHSKPISDLVLFKSPSGQQLIASASRDGWVKIWDFNSGRLLDKISSENKAAVLSLVYNEEDQLLYFGSLDRKVYTYDLKNRKLKNSFQAHQGGVCFLALRKEENQLVSKSVEGELKFWDLKADEPQDAFTYFQLNSTEWLITQPAGYFDGSAEAMKQINYVSGMKSLKVESFFKKYYYPGLYNELNSGFQMKNKDRGLEEMMEGIPQYELYFNNFQGKHLEANVDSIYLHNRAEIDLELRFKSDAGEISQILIYNNGKLVKQEDFEKEITFRGGGKNRTITVPLAPKENKISVRLSTTNGLSTEEKKIRFYFDTLSGKTELFILSLGINKYENERYNLNYAGNDADAFSKTIENGAKELFHEIHSFELTDKKVTRANVMKTINEMSQKMGPEDVFIFFYAGHGVMLQNGNQSTDFYLVMSDVTNLYGDRTMMDSKAISAKDLLQISKNLPAQKQVFVLDACQSGAALKELAIRGVEREKTIAQLARSSGTFFLTASQDVEYANEVGNLKHGIFTYAILELLNGESEKAQKNETISIYELKSYVETRVPELTKEYRGSAQYPTGYSFGNDFPIGVVR